MEDQQKGENQQQQQQQQQKKEKTKIRLTSLDITVLVNDLRQKLIGQRVQNIYDLSNKMYCFKMGSAENKNEFIIENGVRFNVTNQEITKKKVPSAFTMKFRKYLRSKRLEDIRQVGVERVVVLTFGSGELTNHLIIELYAQGNILLTDKEYRIIQLIRSHEFTETVKTAVGEFYPFGHAANLYLEKFDTSEDNIRNLIQTQIKQEEEKQQQQQEQEKQQKEQEEADKNNKKAKFVKREDGEEEKKEEEDEEEKKKKKKGQQAQKTQKTKKQPTQKKSKAEKEKKLKDVVFKIVPSLHQPVIDHVISELGINPNQKCSEEQIPDIQRAAKECIELTKKFMKQKPKGYLLISDNQPKQEEQKEGEQKKAVKERYFEFSPLILNSHEGKKYKEVYSFNDVIDTYFQQLVIKENNDEGGQNNQFNQKQNIILKKFNNIIKDQDNRIKHLQSEQELSTKKAQLIEKNIPDVDAIANIIRQMKQGGLAWDKIYKMINEGKEQGDPLANLIEEMDFDRNRITILLYDPDEDDQEDEMTPVEIDINDNAYTNAKNYYQNKKSNYKKELKTQEAKDIAMKQAEITAQRELEKNSLKQKVVTNRKTYWFEKFLWFISTENYLVVSGRDATQNEVLIKKYMRKGDIYIHADYHGAASTIIKNNNPHQPIPQQTIEEAASASVCRSKAWDSKILASAYWVYDDQVSKRAETGEYLPHGSFMIRGKKNFITPMRIEMGVALLYSLNDEESIKRHVEDRQVKKNEGEQEQEELQARLLEMNKQESNVTDASEMPSYEMLKQQSSMISNSQPEKDEVTLVNMINPKPNDSKITNYQKQPKPNKQQIQQQEAKRLKEQQLAKDGKKGKLSKRQLRALEKQGGGDDDEEEDDKQENNINVPRGKANKIRKMKKKYGDQTEEEREYKMKLLGAKKVEGFDWKVEQARRDKKFNGKQHDEIEKEIKEEMDNEQKLQQQQQQQQQEEEKVQEQEQQDDKDKKQEEKQEQEEEEELLDEDELREIEEEKKMAAEQKKIKYEEEENKINQELQELNRFSTYILPEDTYSHLIFMCAPYQTLQQMNCKYRVKLIPGTQKKGKASREIITYFQSMKEATPQEKNIMKCISDKEMIDQIIGNCKVNAQGLLKIKQQEKNKKKSERKAQDRAEEQINMIKTSNQ